MVFKNSNRAFTLVEMLAVIAIILILSTMAIVGFNSIVASTRLEQAGRTVVDEINLARQTAVTRNENVEVRFIKSVRSDSGGSTPFFWQLQSGTVDKDGQFKALQPVAKLPVSVVMTGGTLSPILANLSEKTMEGNSDKFIAFTIRPSGEIDPTSGLSITDRKKWCVTVVPERKSTETSTSSLDDFITVQVDPMTSRPRIFRP